jgi:hypothetical protein
MSPLNRRIAAVLWLVIFPCGVYSWWRERHQPLAKLMLLVALVH